MSTRLSIFASLLLASTLAHAQQPPDTIEAGKRFTAGVALYNETDYRAALVEFKRAYEIAPSPTVLYNIGQTYFQLQNYAAAYLTLSRYLSESGADAEHKDEVTQTIQLLQARIGKIAIATDVVGAEITIDDEVIGKTPLVAPVLVSVGRRRISVTAPGKVPQNLVIDIAAGDTVRHEIVLQDQARAAPAPVVVTPSKAGKKSDFVMTAWIATGGLAVGTAAMGILAWRASDKLEELRGTYPVTRDALANQSDKVRTYSYVADGLGVATILVGTTAVVLTLLRDSPADKERGPQVGIGPRGIVVGGTF